MIALRPLFACAALTVPLVAQDIAPTDTERDPVLSALHGELEDEDMPSVTVDISASAQPLVPEEEPEPVLVTGKPPEDAETAPEPEPAPPEPEGVTVSVEPGSGAHGTIDASAVKLLAPFPAKPLALPPAGWRLEHPKEVPAFNREVPLSNGTRISLSIRPHLMVPDADGQNVFAVNEPGYDPALRYAQTGTMSAVLSSSIEGLDEDARKMSDALDRLGQLLSSLPTPEAPPEPAALKPAKKSR